MRMLSLSEHPVNLTDDPVPSSAHVNGLSNDLRRAEETRVVLPISARTPTSDTKRDTSSPSFAAARSGVWYMFWFMRKCTSELVEGPCTPPPGGSEAQAPQAQAPAGSRRLPQAPAGSRRIPQAPAGWLRPRPTGPAGSKTLHFLVGSVVAEKAVVLSCGDQSRLQQL